VILENSNTGKFRLQQQFNKRNRRQCAKCLSMAKDWNEIALQERIYKFYRGWEEFGKSKVRKNAGSVDKARRN
jgi:hypothetical protein